MLGYVAKSKDYKDIKDYKDTKVAHPQGDWFQEQLHANSSVFSVFSV